jgi:branched-chain amino acid aminotransferase
MPNDKLVFGATMTDHMLEVDWHHESGWGAPRIVPYHALAIDPAASVLHYGIEAFEGMKAYRDDAGGIRLFRPDLNMARLANSMDRLAGPPLDRAGFTACLAELVRQEADWIPAGEGFSLYLRPTFK